MTRLLLCYNAAAASSPCALCKQPAEAPPGLQIVEAGALGLVCPACARRHAAPLAALAGLAEEARRVGRIGRHTVFPPYTALLDLARAADLYSSAVAPAAG